MTERNDELVGRGPTAAGGATGASGAESGASETGAIRAEIADTRDRLGETLAQIGDRLNPSHIASQVKETVRGATVGRAQDAVRDVAGRVGTASEPFAERVREYPLAAVAIAAGLGWLLAGSRASASASQSRSSSGGSSGQSAHPRSSDSGVRYPIRSNPLTTRPAYAAGSTASATSSPASFPERSSAAGAPFPPASSSPAANFASTSGDAAGSGGGIKATAGEVADRAREAVGHAASRAKELGSTVASQAQQQTHQLEERLHETPLQAGVVALALGFAAGYVVPVSEREVQLMGTARDRLADRVRGTVEETKESVRDAVRQAVQGGSPGGSQA